MRLDGNSSRQMFGVEVSHISGEGTDLIDTLKIMSVIKG